MPFVLSVKRNKVWPRDRWGSSCIQRRVAFHCVRARIATLRHSSLELGPEIYSNRLKWILAKTMNYYYWSLLYSAILHSRADSLRSHVILHCECIAFYSTFLNIHRSGVLTALAWLVPHETTAIIFLIASIWTSASRISLKACWCAHKLCMHCYRYFILV